MTWLSSRSVTIYVDSYLKSGFSSMRPTRESNAVWVRREYLDFEVRPCVRRFFSEIFVFANFGNWLFLNFGNISVMSEPSEHVPTLVFAKNLQKLGSERAFYRKLGSERKNDIELVSTRENSIRLETRLKISDKSSECRALFRSNVKSFWLLF